MRGYGCTVALGPDPDGVSVAELVATLSYAADLGLGQPMAHCMRQTVIALRLADLVGASDEDRRATYYLGLMMNSWCHADAAEQARWFGDDISFKGDGYETLGMNTAQTVAFLVRRVGSHGSGAQRIRRLAEFPLTGHALVSEFLRTHCELGAEFAARIGLGEPVAAAVHQAYEQWDGKGEPGHLRGAAISLPARLVQLAGPVEVFSRRHGVEAARSMSLRHRGTYFDPTAVDLFRRDAQQLLDGLDQASEWDAVLALDPALSQRVSGTELDAVLLAMADLVDQKSPQFAGHSRGVATLAGEAARICDLPNDEITSIRRAGLIHDLGRLGVSNAVWDKPGLLDERRVRAGPAAPVPDRTDARPGDRAGPQPRHRRPPPRAAGRVRVPDRADGSLTGHRRPAFSLPPTSTTPRPRAAPHRPALTGAQAGAHLRQEVRAGRLDGAAVDAVLTAAGHRAPTRHAGPAGLTAREVEVLGLVAHGLTNKQIASRLQVTPKTASNHVEHVYLKIAVNSRAAATLWATQHGLVGSFEVGQH